MNKDFDFDDIGKRMPYKAPDSFFEEMRHKVMQRTGAARGWKRRLRIIIPAFVTVAAVVAGFFFSPFLRHNGGAVSTSSCTVSVTKDNVNSETMATFIENLSDEDLEELAGMSETDIFLY